MAKFGWFDQWVRADGWTEAREMRAINEADEAIGSLEALQDLTTQRIAKLYEIDGRQGRELVRLRATLETLVDLMIDKGLIAENELRYRLEARVSELEPSPAVPADGPVGDGP